MSQLYARVFLQILDSSIAEDFTLRHVFEDFFKVCDYKTGVLDMTRESLSRRLNIPLEMLNEQILKLESPDPHSRDRSNDGRRIARLDDHRDWGWQILNWKKYEAIRDKALGAHRVSKFRNKTKDDNREVVVPLVLAGSSDFMVWWEKWLEHLKAKGKPPTSHAMDIQLTRLDKMGLERAVECIKGSIEHNWQGLYEMKDQSPVTVTDINNIKDWQ
jgi:hypothetical protein